MNCNEPFYTKLLLTNPLLIFLTWFPGKIHLAQLDGQIALLCMKLITEGTGTERIKKWMVLYLSGNFQDFKKDLALWVALVYDTQSSNSHYNNAQFMYI